MQRLLTALLAALLWSGGRANGDDAVVVAAAIAVVEEKNLRGGRSAGDAAGHRTPGAGEAAAGAAAPSVAPPAAAPAAPAIGVPEAPAAPAAPAAAATVAAAPAATKEVDAPSAVSPGTLTEPEEAKPAAPPAGSADTAAATAGGAGAPAAPEEAEPTAPTAPGGSPAAGDAAAGGGASAASAEGAKPAPPPGNATAEAGAVPLSTFFWNTHWQCSVAARGSSPMCKARASQRFAELAQGANIVASVELSNGMSDPLVLIPGWTQVNGPCARGYGGDSAALAFEPGWNVVRSSGGCLRHDWDTRAFAVALAQPPTPIQGCPHLCVLAVHAPHRRITVGGDVVRSVCGEVAQRCTVAMGDWNVPAHHLHHRWEELVGGGNLAVVAPNERTCCWPEWQHYGLFDHVATNIAGARLDSYYVHPYQILEERPYQQHKPVFARLALPGAQ